MTANQHKHCYQTGSRDGRYQSIDAKKKVSYFTNPKKSPVTKNLDRYGDSNFKYNSLSEGDFSNKNSGRNNLYQLYCK